MVEVCHFDTLALLLGGGLAVISVGDIGLLRKCSFMINFNSLTSDLPLEGV